MQPLLLILARAGSKGVPGKNARSVAGRPCIEWTIDAARAAAHPVRIAVTTDDPTIQQIALCAGLDLIARPAELASDTATVDDAARHAVIALNDKSLDPIILLYANVPLRPPGVIDRAIELLAHTGADSVQSYQSVGKHHPLWTAVVAPDGAVSPWQGDTLNNNIYRRQDLPPAHIPDGAILAVMRRALFHEIPGVPPGPHAFLGAHQRGIINPPGSVVDIDSELDLLIAETLLAQGAMP